jgi:hypothetical protein
MYIYISIAILSETRIYGKIRAADVWGRAQVSVEMAPPEPSNCQRATATKRTIPPFPRDLASHLAIVHRRFRSLPNVGGFERPSSIGCPRRERSSIASAEMHIFTRRKEVARVSLFHRTLARLRKIARECQGGPWSIVYRRWAAVGDPNRERASAKYARCGWICSDCSV